MLKGTGKPSKKCTIAFVITNIYTYYISGTIKNMPKFKDN